MIKVIILAVVFAVLAVAFDWFGARDLAHEVLNQGQNAVDVISESGDKAKEVIGNVKEAGSSTMQALDELKKAKDAAKE